MSLDAKVRQLSGEFIEAARRASSGERIDRRAMLGLLGVGSFAVAAACYPTARAAEHITGTGNGQTPTPEPIQELIVALTPTPAPPSPTPVAYVPPPDTLGIRARYNEPITTISQIQDIIDFVYERLEGRMGRPSSVTFLPEKVYMEKLLQSFGPEHANRKASGFTGSISGTFYLAGQPLWQFLTTFANEGGKYHIVRNMNPFSELVAEAAGLITERMYERVLREAGYDLYVLGDTTKNRDMLVGMENAFRGVRGKDLRNNEIRTQQQYNLMVVISWIAAQDTGVLEEFVASSDGEPTAEQSIRMLDYLIRFGLRENEVLERIMAGRDMPDVRTIKSVLEKRYVAGKGDTPYDAFVRGQTLGIKAP